MQASKLLKAIRAIRGMVKGLDLPVVSRLASRKDPYLVLISCILSLRTKDKVSSLAADRLFQVADSPQKMIRLTSQRISQLIYPVGFYRNKAKVIKNISHKIVEEFGGAVPGTQKELLSLKGVGLKTANLVLGLGFGRPAICVDTHVHRISNRLGWVKTKTPEETEAFLRRIVPKRYWIELNEILVRFGQNICLPVSPLCKGCTVFRFCPRKGVKAHR